MVLEPKSAFLIHMETVDLRVTFSQSPLDMRDSLITALSCNDFPSQQWGKGHVIPSHVRRHSNAKFFHNDADSRQVVVVSFVAQGLKYIFTQADLNMRGIVFFMSAEQGQLQPTQDHMWDSALHDDVVVMRNT
jgi:hypothetical protein